MGRRGGTENVPGIVGLGTASNLTAEEVTNKIDHLQKLRSLLVSGILDNIEKAKLTGHPDLRLPGHASFCIEAIEGEALIYMLNQEGIYSNTGSACASKALKTSPVLVAIGVPPDQAQGSIVFTMSNNSIQEVKYVLEKLRFAVEKLRSLSPIWRKKTAE